MKSIDTDLSLRAAILATKQNQALAIFIGIAAPSRGVRPKACLQARGAGAILRRHPGARYH
jgi:hypothetical protein